MILIVEEKAKHSLKFLKSYFRFYFSLKLSLRQDFENDRHAPWALLYQVCVSSVLHIKIIIVKHFLDLFEKIENNIWDKHCRGSLVDFNWTLLPKYQSLKFSLGSHLKKLLNESEAAFFYEIELKITENRKRLINLEVLKKLFVLKRLSTLYRCIKIAQ